MHELDASSEIKCFGAIILDRDNPAQPHTLNSMKRFFGKLLKAEHSFGEKLAHAGVLGALLAKVINDIKFIHAITGNPTSIYLLLNCLLVFSTCFSK